ncbi:ComEC/Rec2 family competence protein [bacterium]|nr:ComEC/Rec2 family competence protein [bacterium]
MQKDRLGKETLRTGGGRAPSLVFAFLLGAGIYLGHALPGLGLPAATAAGLVLSLVSFLVARLLHLKQPNVYAAAGLLLCAGFVLLRLHAAEEERRVAAWDFAPGWSALIGHLTGPPWSVEDPWLGRQRTRFRFDIEQWKKPGQAAWRPGGFGLLVEAPEGWEARLSGDERLALTASLRRGSGYSNPGLFDYRAYLEGQGLAGLARVAQDDSLRVLEPAGAGYVQRLRARLNDIQRSLYPDREVRGVAGALVLGLREQNPRPVRQDFILSGTVHVLVVSGLHVGFVAGLLYLILVPLLGRGWGTSILSLSGVCLFALLAGAGPSVLRAAFMCGLALFAAPLERTVRPLNLLAAAFALLLLWNPLWLFDPGFQLSFAAVAGIILFVPHLESRWRACGWYRRPAGWPLRVFLASLAAQLGVAPFLALYFGGVSAAGLAANIFMLPLAGIAVPLGLAADLVALVWGGAAQVMAALNAVVIHAMLSVAHFFAGLDWSWQKVAPPAALEMLLFWLFVWQGVSLVSRRPKAGARLTLVVSLWLAAAAWSAPLSALTDNPEATVLDLGSSNATVLRFPSGGYLLTVPSGGVRGTFSSARAVAVPYLERHRIRRVDWLYLPGLEQSRLRWAWDILDRVAVGTILLPRAAASDSLAFQFLRFAVYRGARLVELAPGDSLRLGAFPAVVGRDSCLSLEIGGADLFLEDGACRVRTDKGELRIVPERGAEERPEQNSTRVLETMEDGAVSLEFRGGGQVAARTNRSGKRLVL